MNIITMGWWILVNIITIDILARLLQRHTRETSKFKAASILAMLIMALNRNQAVILNKAASLKRFALATILVFILSISCCWLLKDGLPVKHNFPVFALALMPLVAMPFYHLLFGLLGNNPIAVSASIRHFRLRTMLGLVIGANIIMVGLFFKANLLIHVVHLCLALIALAHVLFLTSCPRARSAFYNLRQEDFDAGPSAFMNYLASLLEFFYCVLLVYFAFAPAIIEELAPSEPAYLVIPAFIGGIYIITVIEAKLLLVSRALLQTDFYEDKILPLTFLLFGIVFIYQLNF